MRSDFSSYKYHCCCCFGTVRIWNNVVCAPAPGIAYALASKLISMKEANIKQDVQIRTYSCQICTLYRAHSRLFLHNRKCLFERGGRAFVNATTVKTQDINIPGTPYKLVVFGTSSLTLSNKKPCAQKV